jgi:hypothetical protein
MFRLGKRSKELSLLELSTCNSIFGRVATRSRIGVFGQKGNVFVTSGLIRNWAWALNPRLTLIRCEKTPRITVPSIIEVFSYGTLSMIEEILTSMRFKKYLRLNLTSCKMQFTQNLTIKVLGIKNIYILPVGSKLQVLSTRKTLVSSQVVSAVSRTHCENDGTKDRLGRIFPRYFAPTNGSHKRLVANWGKFQVGTVLSSVSTTKLHRTLRSWWHRCCSWDWGATGCVEEALRNRPNTSKEIHVLIVTTYLRFCINRSTTWPYNREKF